MRRVYIREKTDMSGNGEDKFLIVYDADYEHPYIETALLAGAVPDKEGLASWPSESVAAHLLRLAKDGSLRCTEIGTWGDYRVSTDAEVLDTHFVYEHGVAVYGWHKTGNEPNLPDDMEANISYVHTDEALAAMEKRLQSVEAEITEKESDTQKHTVRLRNLQTERDNVKRNYGV